MFLGTGENVKKKICTDYNVFLMFSSTWYQGIYPRMRRVPRPKRETESVLPEVVVLQEKKTKKREFVFHSFGF